MACVDESADKLTRPIWRPSKKIKEVPGEDVLWVELKKELYL